MNKKNRWIKRFVIRDKAPYRLICFHCAGSGAGIYSKWSDSLPEQIELLAVQLPGREDRYGEAGYTNYKSAVKDVVPELLPYLDRPFMFFCHSMGTIIGYEVAMALNGYHNPHHLFLSSSAAPHHKPLFKLISHLPDDEFLKEIINFGGVPKQILNNPDFLKILLPILRRDFQLIESFDYIEGKKLNCPITVFGGTEDKCVPAQKLDGWDAVTTQKTNIRLFPGNHFYFIDKQEEVIEEILRNAAIKYEYQETGMFFNEYKACFAHSYHP